MMIVWDEPKRQANLVKHGMDFAALDETFFAEAAFRPSYSGRILALGWVKNEMIVAVVFRPLGSEAVSIISMRRASKSERKLIDG